MTTPELLAKSQGIIISGSLRCYYCGTVCNELNSVSEYVKSSFPERSLVQIPGSQWVCNGCVLCFRESCEVRMLDGESRQVSKGAMRSFCWIITEKESLAATKAHLEQLRKICLEGLVSPWSIVLTDSGQKHFLYRAVVQRESKEPWVANLDGEPIWYYRDQLQNRLQEAGRLVAVLGKPSLQSPLNVNHAIKIMEAYGDQGEVMVPNWNENMDEPLSRLAIWLCPNKETCQHEYLTVSKSD